MRTSEILWSERIDADASDIIAVQDTIVQRIVDGLRLELSPDEKVELAKGSTADAAASEEYLRGRDCMGQFIYHTISRADISTQQSNTSGALLKWIQNSRWPTPRWEAVTSIAFLKVWAKPTIMRKRRQPLVRRWRSIPKLLEARMHMVFIYLAPAAKTESA